MVSILEIIIAVVVLAILLGGGYKYQSDRRKRKNAAVVADSAEPIESTLEFKTGNWIYLDDIPRGLPNADQSNVVGRISGDGNGPQDLAFTLALALHYNSLPKAIGVTPTRSGRDRFIAKSMVCASGLEIPVIYGAHINHMMPSPLADYIVAESRKSKLDIVVGGTVTDIAQALKQGAVVSNIRIIGTIYETSNEAGDQAAADIVKNSGVRIFNIGSPEYERLIRLMPQTPSIDERALIKKWRHVKMWDRAFSPSVMEKSSAENQHQFGHNLPLRVSDSMNVDRLLSGDPANYKGYLNYPGIVARVENGLSIMSKLKPVDPPKLPDRKPNLLSDFDMSNINTKGFTNAPAFPETSKINKADVRIDSANISHLKQAVWRKMKFSRGFVNANVWLIYKDGDEVCAVPYEYLRFNEGRKDVGWGVLDADFISGDQIGLMVSTIVRRGDLVNGKERSNIVAVTLK